MVVVAMDTIGQYTHVTAKGIISCYDVNWYRMALPAISTVVNLSVLTRCC